LKRKIKPAIEDAASVPMSIFFEFVKYEGGSLFKKFMQLSKRFRKLLIYHVFIEYMHSFAESFNNKVSKEIGFEVQDPNHLLREVRIKVGNSHRV
jgi:hypothetical protein